MIVEKEIIQYLITKNVATGKVYAEAPKNPPAKYVVIERTGGGDINGLNQALIAIRSIGPTLLDAMTLSESVKNAMWDAPKSINVYQTDLNSESNNTNTNTKEYRYLTVWDIKY